MQREEGGLEVLPHELCGFLLCEDAPLTFHIVKSLVCLHNFLLQLSQGCVKVHLHHVHLSQHRAATTGELVRAAC